MTGAAHNSVSVVINKFMFGIFHNGLDYFRTFVCCCREMLCGF